MRNFVLSSGENSFDIFAMLDIYARAMMLWVWCGVFECDNGVICLVCFIGGSGAEHILCGDETDVQATGL